MMESARVLSPVKRSSMSYVDRQSTTCRPVGIDTIPSSEQRRHFLSVREQQRKERVQTNVGRIQQSGCEQYERMMTAASRLQQLFLPDIEQAVEPIELIERSGEEEAGPNLGYRVLEVFDGFVDQISDGVAYVTLKSQFGDVLHGEYQASELERRGIREGRGFRCITIESNGKVSANIEAIRERELTPNEQRAIFDEADKRLGDFVWDD